jgi:hypothetical protein
MSDNTRWIFLYHTQANSLKFSETGRNGNVKIESRNHFICYFVTKELGLLVKNLSLNQRVKRSALRHRLRRKSEINLLCITIYPITASGKSKIVSDKILVTGHLLNCLTFICS